MTIRLPGGWTLELAQTSNGSPPDRQGGMSTNVACTWQRLRWPFAVDTGWHKALDWLGFTKIAAWWQLVATPHDIPDAWDITADVPATPAQRGVIADWIKHLEQHPEITHRPEEPT